MKTASPKAAGNTDFQDLTGHDATAPSKTTHDKIPMSFQPPIPCRVLGKDDDSWVMGYVLDFCQSGYCGDAAIVHYSSQLPPKVVPLDRIRLDELALFNISPVSPDAPGETPIACDHLFSQID